MRPPRWLLVVRREKPELYEKLRDTFAGDKRVEVILDRRQGEDPSATRERRGQRLAARDRDLWESLGFRLIYRTDEVTVYGDPGQGASEEQ